VDGSPVTYRQEILAYRKVSKRNEETHLDSATLPGENSRFTLEPEEIDLPFCQFKSKYLGITLE